MLANVDVRSRPDAQFVENTEGPKGPPALVNWLLCGMEPARSRDKRAALLALFISPASPRFGDGLLNGLGDGVGLEVFAISDGSGPRPSSPFPPGEKRDGTVPARARRVGGPLSGGVGRCAKSGNPSVGDSGMFSRRGVDPPLVGGPQTPRGRPSCACISRALLGNVSLKSLGTRGREAFYLLENNLLELPLPICSCDGEPAPDRVFPAILPTEFIPAADSPKGDLRGFPLPLVASVGEVFAVEEPERGRPTGCGR
jgi:hypothetical protein